jgi:hypothetical protein
VPDTATYVFCLVQSDRAPSVRGAPQSIPGAGEPRALEVDRGLWAIVADAPLDRFSGEQLQQELQDLEAVSRHALAHASIVEFFFQRAPVIPLKLFTLFSEDARARRQLWGRKTQLRRLFAELRGFEEWGVRITSAIGDRTDAPSASGRGYLEVKKRLRDEAAAPPPATVKELKTALRALSRLASRTRQDKFPPPGKGRPYVTGGSYLVKATRRTQWKKQAAQLAASLDKRGHHLEMSGPWPPYHFVSR